MLPARGTRPSRRDAAGLGGAVLVHAVFAALVVYGPSPSLRVEPPKSVAEIDLSLEPSPTAPRPETKVRASAQPVVAAVAVHHVSSAAVETAIQEGASQDGPSPSPPAPAPEPPLDLRGPLVLSADAIGLGGRNPFLGAVPDHAATPARTETSPENVAPGVQQSLRDALHEHDHGIGLDIGGPIVAVAEDVTRPSAAPVDSHAVFEVTADAGGNVTSVSLVDASEGHAEWERVAASLREGLRTRKLRVPGGSGGVVVTLEITSRWQLPSGHDPDTEVSLLGIPLKKARKESKRPDKVEILKPDVKIVEAPPQPGTATGVRLPQYQLKLVDLLNLDIDPTDVAPRPLRVVHARVVKERVL